jgi:hypothetical protein
MQNRIRFLNRSPRSDISEPQGQAPTTHQLKENDMVSHSRGRRAGSWVAVGAALFGLALVTAQSALTSGASAVERGQAGNSVQTLPRFAATNPGLDGAGQSPHGTGQNGCIGRALLFCEDFNALPLGAATSPNWTVDTQQGTLTVEPITRGSRNRILHAHTVGNGRALLTIGTFHAPGNTYFGRMWVKVAAFPVAPDFAHFMLVQATGTGSTEMVRPVGGQFVNTQFLKNGGPARSLWGIGADGGATGDWTNWKESATAVPGQWQCIEWTMQAADSKVQLWIDGVANPDLLVTANNHGGKAVPFVLPTVNKIQIGWWLFQPGSNPLQFDVRYDNIALSSTRIGCGGIPRSR